MRRKKLPQCGSGVIFAEFNLATDMAKEIDFENGNFRKFTGCDLDLDLG